MVRRVADAGEYHDPSNPPFSMAATLHSDIDSLIAPGVDGAVLVHPRGELLLDIAQRNRDARSRYSFRLAGRPVEHRPRLDGPLTFMTGHQPEFFHPGVWLKGAAAGFLARRAGGTATYLVVDSDVPGRVALACPVQSGGQLSILNLKAAIDARRSWEQFDAADVRQIRRLLLEPALVAGDSEPAALAAFRTAWTDTPDATSAGHVDRWIRAMDRCHELARVPACAFLRISDVFSLDDDAIAADFVAHLVLNAGVFASAYNAALAEYRLARRIRGTQHPVPDLLVADGVVELPFWLLRAGRPRARLGVRHSRDDVELLADGQPVGRLALSGVARRPAAALRGALPHLHLRPRALTQTMFARLFLCDLFIHGIGGAKYDQITDGIIRRFFNVDPPGYACISGTLRLPLPRKEAAPGDLEALRRVRRDVRFNPQRYLADRAGEPAVHERIIARQSAIAESDRLRRESPRAGGQRRDAFLRIRRLNDELQPFVARGLLADRNLDKLRADIDHNRIADSREWFFAIYPDNKLMQLREAVEQAL